MDHDAVDRDALAKTFRLAAIAVASALVTATVVIGVGGVWLERSGQAHVGQTAAAPLPVQLIRTSG